MTNNTMQRSDIAPMKILVVSPPTVQCHTHIHVTELSYSLMMDEFAM